MPTTSSCIRGDLIRTEPAVAACTQISSRKAVPSVVWLRTSLVEPVLNVTAVKTPLTAVTLAVTTSSALMCVDPFPGAYVGWLGPGQVGRLYSDMCRTQA